MSSDALSTVWRMPEPRGTERLVLAVLADHAGHDMTVSMPQRAIASASALSKGGVAEAISRLVRAGHIAVIDGGGGYRNPSAYRLLVKADAPTKGAHYSPSAGVSAPTEGASPAPTKAPGDDLPPDPMPEALPEATARDRAAAARPEHATLADRMQAASTPVAPPSYPSPRPATAFAQTVTDGHPVSIVGAILTAVGVPPDPDDFWWWRREHKEDAAALVKLAGGGDALLDTLRARAARAPKAFRRLTALAEIVTEGRG